MENDNEIGAFALYNWQLPNMPILLSVPHAGRDYPPELLANLRVSPRDLMRLEDRYADRLVQSAIAAGASVIIAQKARGWIDLNRAEDDIDYSMISNAGSNKQHLPSSKARGGLGLIPRRLMGCGELWRRPLNIESVQNRIDAVHRPYHYAIAEQLKALQTQFGAAILLDIHSMPPLLASDDPPQIIVGDRYGKSASSRYSELILSYVGNAGIKSALNHPYAGDYILRHHANVAQNIHAIQIEIDRSLYLDDALLEPSPGVSTMAALLSKITLMLSDDLLEQYRVAAE